MTGVELARLGEWPALNPKVAEEFAEMAARKNPSARPQIFPLVHRADKPGQIHLTGEETTLQVIATIQDAFDRGHDAVMLRNYTTPGGLKHQDILVTKNPNQLRSRFAAFDPKRRDSADLLASTVPFAVLGGASAIEGDEAR